MTALSIRSRNKVSQKANKGLKKIFHMAALSTLRTDGELRKYYDRKVEEGKHKMSVINAIRSKLVHRIFAVINQNRKYEKIYTHPLAKP
ncbi:transposase [Flammeovirgaceae bacterium SG7u.111]|nr:transposase [Flammeovirgaceae bacterium SG7u.111]